MRISDWSSDVCSSDLFALKRGGGNVVILLMVDQHHDDISGRDGGRIVSRETNIPECGEVRRQFLDIRLRYAQLSVVKRSQILGNIQGWALAQIIDIGLESQIGRAHV